MAMNIRNARVERLAEELADMTGESKTTTILRALEERRERIVRKPNEHAHMASVIDFLEKEIWPTVPKDLLGRRIPKEEQERILGYGKRGV